MLGQRRPTRGQRRGRTCDFKDARHRGQSAPDQREGPAESEGGPRQIREVAIEGHQGTETETPFGDGCSADPENDEGPEPSDEGHERKELRLRASQGQAPPLEFAIGGGERTPGVLLHGVAAHDAHAGQILLHRPREHAELGLHGVGLLVHDAVDAREEDDQRGSRRHRPQGQPGIDSHHGCQRPREREEGAHQTHESEPHQRSDGRHIAGGPRHQITGPVGGVKGRRVRLQRTVEIVAHVVLHALRAAHEREP